MSDITERLRKDAAAAKAAGLSVLRITHEEARDLFGSIDSLRAQVEALRADAQRYRWLRDNMESDWAICEWSHEEFDGVGYYRDARPANVVDAAIDAARSQEAAG